MPLIPEEPQIYESVPGPRVAPAAGRNTSTPRPVPGPPRPAAPRPAPPRPPAAGVGPGRPGPARPAAPPVARPSRDSAADGGTVQVQLIPATVSGAIDAADEAVDLLLDSGRAPGDVLVVTTGDPHPWAAHELSFGEASYWAQYDAADDVFCAGAEAALGERVTGRPVVVVAVNGGTDESVARVLPAAMERAGALLVVCGDSDRVTAMLAART